jgi:tetratricopeptide (TPR) repeat protein
VVTNYEGFIEKFIGDAVVALFGVPQAHEDDPIRAIRAAREIHDRVQALSPEIEKRIGCPISMHSGIRTGMVVAGEVDMEKGTHGVSGETINLASRLSDRAQAHEILVGLDTCRQAEGYFAFEALGPMEVKGKTESVAVYRVLSPKERPITIHRLSGLRAGLVGRRAEMAQLREAVENLREGKGTILSICGDAGTGKSRLVEEFKATLDLNQIQWLEGHAHAYAQNIPYFPLIDLLSRTLQIEEGDPSGTVREKVESYVELLLGKKGDVAPYIGSLYALRYPEIAEVSPEFWKSRLREAVQSILFALTRRGPTIVCLEDLQWADPSSLDLLRFLLSESRYPALFLCVYRLPFSLFASHQLSGMGKSYQEIRLQDLSPSDTQDMMESLLKSRTLPSDLTRFIQQKVEGNPFYLEEVMNSLIESGALTRDNGAWKLTRPLGESDIPPTVQGVISARIDRLEREMKRILQEASVIGRTFLYEILRKITELRESLDRYLHGLEQLDLIRTRSFQPEVEYIFKHALTQEVVYNGLLKKERQAVHERIALVMEQLFGDRLSEFYETLAFHFKRGHSIPKAVHYLVKSGEKSLGRCAVEESHRYYQEAFELVGTKSEKSADEKRLLIDVLIKWCLVYYYRGDFKGMLDLLMAHLELAESLDDRARLGMFYTVLGFGFYGIGKPTHAHSFLSKALTIGEEIENQPVIGYACTWLAWTCAELGLLEDAIKFGERAHETARAIGADHYLYFKSLAAIAHNHLFRGEGKKSFEIAADLLDYGKRHSDVRCLTVGHICMGYGHFAAGDFESALQCFKNAAEVSADPLYSQWSRLFLGGSYVLEGQFQEGEEALQDVVQFCQDLSCHLLQPFACACLGVSWIAKGQMSKGLKMIEDVLQTLVENDRKCLCCLVEYILGKVFLGMVEGAGPIGFSTMTKNIGFFVRNLPFASKRAEAHFNKAIEVADQVGCRGVMGMAHLGLGLLHQAKGRKDKARKCLCTAIEVFEQCEAQAYLKQAREALESLNGDSS